MAVRQHPAAAFAITLLTVAIVAGGILSARYLPDRRMPAFHAMDQPVERKVAFFGYLSPIIGTANERVREQRDRLRRVATEMRAGEEPGWMARWWLEDLAEEYRLNTEEAAIDATFVERLLSRVDVVPRSLVLVQAAKESGWGRSRFAREGNNLFGQRCFDTGCGIVPKGRATGGAFEVRTFDSVTESVRSYIRNLNTHSRYRRFRELRADLRENDRPLSGIALAKGLSAYSERGDAYVREIRSMIRQNDLETPIVSL